VVLLVAGLGWTRQAGADVASPYRGDGVYVASGAGAWHGLYLNIPGVPAGRGAACTFPGGGEPDSFKPGGAYHLTGSRASAGPLTAQQIAFAFKIYGTDGSSADGEALDAIVARQILGESYSLSSAGQASYTKISNAAVAYKGVAPKITGLVTSPAGRFNTTYTATVTGDKSTKYTLSASGATLSTSSVTTSSSGTATFSYKVPGTNTTGNFTITIAGTVYARMDEYSAVDQPAAQSQTVVTWGSGPVSATARGSVEPFISASIVKLTAGDATKTPRVATFKVVDHSTGVTLTNSFTTLAGRPTPLNGFVPGHVYYFTETKAPAGAYIPNPATFTLTIPTTAADGYVITLTDPKTPVLTVGTHTNYQLTPYGVALTDKVSLGGDDGENGTITGGVKLLPGVACGSATAAQWAAAPVVGPNYTTAIVGTFGDGHGNGTYTISGPIPTAGQVGAWGWFETAKLTQSGATATSPYGAPNECSDVTRPAVSTLASEPAGLTGDELVDQVQVSGLAQRPAGTSKLGTITSSLFWMPFTDDTAVCPVAGTSAGEQAWASFIQARPDAAVSTQSFDVTGDATLHTAPYKVSQLGCYSYGTTFTAAAAGSTAVVLGAVGAAGESSTIIAPQVSTVLHSQTDSTSPSVTFTDDAAITGTHGVAVTLLDKLLGPATPDASRSCATATYSADQVAGIFDPVTVSTDQTVTTAALTVAKGDKAACFLAWESLTITDEAGQARTVYTAPIGTETTEMRLAPGKAAGGASSGGYVVPPTKPQPTPTPPAHHAPPPRVNTGTAAGGSGNPVQTAIGLLLVLGAAGLLTVVIVGRRRSS
jgi:hypothetical protein